MHSTDKLRLLIVEDDATDFRQLRGFLRERNPERYFVKHASNLEQVAALLEDLRFDVILLDASLPDGSGTDQLKAVQRLAPDTLIVSLGTSQDEDLGFAPVQSGAQDFLVKEELTSGGLCRAIEHAVARFRFQQNSLSQEALLRSLLDQMTELAIVVDPSGHVTSGQDNLRRVLGHQPEALHFKTWINLLHPDDQEAARAGWIQALSQPGSARQIVARLPRPDGAWHEHHLTLTNRLDDPSIGGVLVSGPDVAAAVRQQRLVRGLADISRTLLTTPDLDVGLHAALAIAGATFEIDEIRVFQYQAGDRDRPVTAKQRAAWSAHHSRPGDITPVTRRALDDAEVYGQLRDEARRNPISSMIQLTPRRSPGETNILVEPLVLVPIYAHGAVWGVVMLTMPGAQQEWSDEHRAAIKAVVDLIGAVISRSETPREREPTHDGVTKVLDRIQGGVLLYDARGELTYANAAVEAITGMAPDQFFASQVSYLDGGADQNLDQTFEHLGGRLVHARIDISAFIDDAGNRNGGVISVQDTSSIRRAAQMMHANQTRLRSIVATAIEGILTLDSEGRIESLNPAAERMFGISSSAAVGEHLSDLTPQDATDAGDMYLHRYLKTPPAHPEGQVQELRAVRADGTVFPIEMNLRHYDHRNQRKYIVSIRDISKQKAAESRVGVQLRQLQALHRVDRVLSASRDQDVILDVVADQVVTAPDLDVAIIRTFSSVLQRLELQTSHGLAANEVAEPVVMLGAGLAGRAAFDQRPARLRHRDDALVRDGDDASFAGQTSVDGLAIPLVANAQLKGTLEVYSFDRRGISDESVDFLNSLGYQVANAIDGTELFTATLRSKQLLESAYEATLEGWSRALEMRGVDTEGHAIRVSRLAVQLGEAMGLEGDELKTLRRGALLHDIGKIGIPDSVLHKPGKLDEADWELIREVPNHAMDLLGGLPFLREASSVPYFHNEKWDGTGYPNGLAGEAIPLEARIFSLVDVWDTLMSDRPYRRALPRDSALAQIASLSGSNFDPDVVRAFLDMIGEAPPEITESHDVPVSESMLLAPLHDDPSDSSDELLPNASPE